MAVLLRIVQAFPDGTRHVVPTLYPTGRAIGKEERERAERFDAFLDRHIPSVVAEVERASGGSKDPLAKWYALGRRLSFVDDASLVPANDRDSGLVWLAIRQHLPASLLPAGEALLTPEVLTARLSGDAMRRLGKKHDHFERCYKLGKYDPADVEWMTWSDFDAFLESPGLERDPRILPLLRLRVSRLGRRLKRTEIRSIFKSMREAIPTKHTQRDTTRLSEPELLRLVEDAFTSARL